MALDGSRAEFYRQSAARLRELAEAYELVEIKDAFEKIARQYERLAAEVERGLIGR